MRRRNSSINRNNVQQDHDSDQSISEEEDGLDGEWTGSTTFLGGTGDKGGVQLLSQLEMLAGSYGVGLPEESISCERKVNRQIDEKVVNPPSLSDGKSSNCSLTIVAATSSHFNRRIAYLPTAASVPDSDEEIISDDEEINLTCTLRSARENDYCTWSEASREVEELAWLNENTSHSLSRALFVKENRSAKGGVERIKSKPKFIFHSRACTGHVSLVGSDRTSSGNIPPQDEIGDADCQDTNQLVCEPELIFDKKESKQSEKNFILAEVGHKHSSQGHSMADFLDCLQERPDQMQASSEMKRGKGMPKALNRTVSLLGDRKLDGMLPEAFDDPLCSDDEEIPEGLKSNFSRTMVDQFHEAFGAMSAIDGGPSIFPRPSCGMHQQLQQVIQSEKDKDMNYIKNISEDQKMSISVRILSRSLEAKLIVCSCTSCDDEKKPYLENKFQMRIEDGVKILTIIFNPRMCRDVELEVGNLILVHPPWKEVHLHSHSHSHSKGNESVIVLCTYFSQLQG